MESDRIIRRKDIWKIRRGGQSNILFSEVTDMGAGIRSGVYRDILCGWGISSMVMGCRLKSGIPKSAVKGL